MRYRGRYGHIDQCTHFLHKLIEDGVPALLLLEGLAEVEEGDAWPVAPEVGLQTACHHWNMLIHQIEQWAMIWRWTVTERVNSPLSLPLDPMTFTVLPLTLLVVLQNDVHSLA